MTELDCIKIHKEILDQCKKQNKKTLTSFDEFLTSTNPTEASALQKAIIENYMNKYPNNINIISTHNPFLIKTIEDSTKAKLMHVVIDRYPDGTYRPLYTIANGFSAEKVGIDLYEKETEELEIARIARNIVKQIEKDQRKIKSN